MGILEEFFESDGQNTGHSMKRSVLLSLEKDMAFCIAMPNLWKKGRSKSKIQLTNFQFLELRKILPMFTTISLFCSAIDVMARVSKKQKPPYGMNGKYFKECAQKWFELGSDEAEELWNLRNGISHSYRLIEGQRALSHGNSSPILKNETDGRWEFYLHAMYRSLTQAKRRLYDSLASESVEEKNKTEKYLEENGFFYITIPGKSIGVE